MPTDYVSDYEEVTGLKPDGAVLVQTKVVAAPVVEASLPVTVADTKAVPESGE